MKIVVDRTKCTGLGICESLAPRHFEIDDEGTLEILDDDVTDETLADVEEAIEGCPTAALRLEK